MFFKKKSKKSTDMSDPVSQIGRDILSSLDHGVTATSTNYSSGGYNPGYESYSTTTSQGATGYGGGVSRIVNTSASYGASGYDAVVAGAGGSSGGGAAVSSSYGVTSYSSGGGDIDSYSRVSANFNRSNESAIQTNEFISKVESAMLNTPVPINSSENEEITVQGYRGVWLNKIEVDNWAKSSPIPITKFELNVDPNPEIITKRADQKIEYQQELAVRYLRPPTPPAPGELIIKEENVVQTSAAPPIIIRQRPPRAPTPEPIIIREAPPQPPAAIGRKVVTIKKKHVQTTPRKLIVEKLPALPSKPQSIIVEKWLPYKQQKRKVIYQKAAEVAPIIHKQRNLIIQWELPAPLINKEYKYLGVVNADPVEYTRRYGTLLKRSSELPTFISEIKTPDTLLTTVDYSKANELEGDLEALKLIDLDQEGLSEYKAFVHRFSYTPGSSGGAFSSSNVVGGSFSQTNVGGGYSSATVGGGFSSSGGYSSSSSYGVKTENFSTSYLESLIEEAFSSVDIDRSGSLDYDEASRILLRLNSRLGRRYGEDELKAFFAALDVNNDKRIDVREFKRAFVNKFHQ